MPDSTQPRTPFGTRLSVVLCCVLFATAIATATATAPADAQELTILRYEPLAELSITEPSAVASGETAAAGPTISFTAFGTPFVIALTRNDALTRNLPPAMQARLGAAEFYTGTLAGNAASWVRLTRTGTALSGALWDGKELYAIEQFERVAAHVVVGAAVMPADPIIYRWADTLSAVTDSMATPAMPGGAAAAQKPAMAPGVFDELAASQSKLAPAQQLDIGLLADSEFVQRHGSSAETNMLSVANVVDGIFFSQLGVRINVADLRTYGAETDAFAGTNASALLDQLEQLKFDAPELRSKGLVHLLTGRDLDERPNTPAGGRLLGVANLGVLCHARLAAGLTQYTDLNTAAVVAAHEIAHNFGAPHDTEAGSACQAASDGYLMAPFVNGSRTFSGCSVQQMEPQLAAAACLMNLPANDLSVQRLDGPAEVIATRPFNLSFAMDYGGPAEALEPLLTITAGHVARHSLTAGLPAVCDYWRPSPMTCRFGRFPASSGRVEFRAGFVASQGGPAYVDVEVTALNDYTPANNRYRFEFDVIPDARFVLQRAVAPAGVKPGELFEVDWTVLNKGSIFATDVRAVFRVTDAYQFVGVETPSGAACSPDPQTFDWSCPIGAVAPGAAVPLKLKLRADNRQNIPPGSTSGGTLYLTMLAAEPIFNWENSWVGPGVQIAPQISDVYLSVAEPAGAAIGSKVTFTLRGGNRGPDPVANARTIVRVYPQRGLAFDAKSNRGTCAMDWRTDIVCELGALASGETFEVVLDGTVAAQENTVDIWAGAPPTFDNDRSNNAYLAVYMAAVPPPPPASTPPSVPTPEPTLTAPPASAAAPQPLPATHTGGGGAVDLLWLLLLLGVVVWRSPSRPRLLQIARNHGRTRTYLRSARGRGSPP